MVSSFALLFVGASIAVLGGYMYRRKQQHEAPQNSPLNTMSMLGASYIMAFGGILAIIAIFLLSQQ